MLNETIEIQCGVTFSDGTVKEGIYVYPKDKWELLSSEEQDQLMNTLLISHVEMNCTFWRKLKEK